MHRVEQVRNAVIYGIRPKRTFRDAAIRYLDESSKSSLRVEMVQLKHLYPFIGDLPLESVHMGTLQPFIESRKAQKSRRTNKTMSKRTVNYALQVVRQILNLAASVWMDEHGMTWLQYAPKIRLLREDDKKEPFPLSPGEQVKLFAELPKHLAKMALFAVNTGCREQEVCGLRWEWEVPIPEMNTSVFIVPAHKVKNRQDRLIILNRVAYGIIQEIRESEELHPDYVFTYRGKPVGGINTKAWRNARERAGLPDARVHDLKHTFGRRLRAAGVSFEDRQDLLGHKSSRVTTHYSRPELENLISAANKVCTQEGESHTIDTMAVLRKKIRQAG